MVVSKRQVADRTDGNHVVHDHHTLFDRAHTEDRDLGLTDDRQAKRRAEDARVRDGERPALHFFRLQLFAARAARQILNRAAHADHVAFVGILDDRHDQPSIQGHGDAEVDVALVDDVVAVDRGVGEREVPNHVHRRLRDKCGVRQLQPGGLVFGLLLLANLVDAAEVHLVRRVHVRRRAQAHHHVFGDLLAHHPHRLDPHVFARGERLHGWEHGRRAGLGRARGRLGGVG